MGRIRSVPRSLISRVLTSLPGARTAKRFGIRVRGRFPIRPFHRTHLLVYFGNLRGRVPLIFLSRSHVVRVVQQDACVTFERLKRTGSRERFTVFTESPRVGE